MHPFGICVSCHRDPDFFVHNAPLAVVFLLVGLVLAFLVFRRDTAVSEQKALPDTIHFSKKTKADKEALGRYYSAVRAGRCHLRLQKTCGD